MNCSQDMFEDSDEGENGKLSTEDICWRGVPLFELKRKHAADILPVRPSHNHQVLFKVPLEGEDWPPTPYGPEVSRDYWDNCHVRFPHSPRSLFPVSQSEVKPRWSLVKEALSERILSSLDLERAIYSYNLRPQQQASRGSLTALHQFFTETMSPEESDYFFESLLPDIIREALKVEDYFKSGLKLLREGSSESVSLSQTQVGVLLANAFLCTFPRRPLPHKYPYINFIRLFQCGSIPNVQEKLKCFVNYFQRICKKPPGGVVTFSRRHLPSSGLPDWAALTGVTLSELHVCSEGTIEREGRGLLEIDFANKMIGGGVLGRGSVQEEIKFLSCPELVVSRLFTEALADTEALIAIGCEEYNKYSGYGASFKWEGGGSSGDRETTRDVWLRQKTYLAAIDATYFSDPASQYSISSLRRELNKAYVGFSAVEREGCVATGNWGCGVFRGDPRLKALLQLMAAAAAGVSLAYFTFGDTVLRDELHEVWDSMRQNHISVGRLWSGLSEFCLETVRQQGTTTSSSSLYQFLRSHLQLTSPSAPSYGLQKEIQEPDQNLLREQVEEEENRITASSPTTQHSDENQIPTEEAIEKNFTDIRSNDISQEVPKRDRESLSATSCFLSTQEGRQEVPKRDRKTSEGCGESLSATSFLLSTQEGRQEVPKRDRKTSEGRGESLSAKSCLLSTPEGRTECLAVEKTRWEAYRSAIRTVSKPKPTKRKISDYFQKIN